jgi:hypothetical protein
MTARLSNLTALAVTLALVHCGARDHLNHAASPPTAAAKAELPAAHVDADEAELVRRLASVDARIARRAGVEPSPSERGEAALAAVLQSSGDDTSVQGEALDVFAFEARRRALDGAAARAGSWPALPDVNDGPGPTRPRLERELFLRFVASERLRVDMEESLPGGASDLVRAVIDTWDAPRNSAAMRIRDQWLAERLDRIHESLAKKKLGRHELVELDDALDPLERTLESGNYPASLATLTRLRIDLAAFDGGAAETRAWDEVGRALDVHLGVRAEEPSLRRMLEQAERALRAEASPALGKLSRDALEGVTRDAVELLVGASPSDGVDARASVRVEGSRVRAFSPPPEREAVPRFLRAAASDARDRLAETVALHDAIVFGLWALDVHAKNTPVVKAVGRSRPLLGFAEREERWVRRAVTRPVVVLGAAVGAAMIARESGDARKARAARWLAFGDAPFDIVEAEVFDKTSAPQPPSVATAAR